MPRDDYQEKHVIHRQYRVTNVNQEPGLAFAIFENPFKGFPDLPDSTTDPETETMEFFPAKAIVPEGAVASTFQAFLCYSNGETASIDEPVDWKNDEYFALFMLDVSDLVVINLTLWWPIKNADKRYYQAVAIPPVI